MHHPGVPASRGENGIAGPSRASTFLLRVVIDVVEDSVEGEGNHRVRTEGYRKSTVMTVPIGPFRSAASRSIRKDSVLDAAVGDDGYLLNRLRHRGCRRTSIARVSLPGVDLRCP